MPTPKKGARLGGSPAHQRLIIANLATSLFEHGKITTTEAKARVLRPVAEKLITKAKKGDLHNRRQVLATVKDKGVVHVLFEEIAPRFAERPGGYTRITKLGPRKGDNAPMAVIELVTEDYAPKARATQRSTAPAATTATAPVAEVGETPADEVTESGADEAPVEDAVVDDTTVEDTTSEATAAEPADVDIETTEEAAADAPADEVAPDAGETGETKAE